jgi:hypothetical protein
MSLAEQTVLFIRSQFEQILKHQVDGHQAKFNPSAEGVKCPPTVSERDEDLNWDADDELSDSEDAGQLSQPSPLPDDQQRNLSDHTYHDVSTVFFYCFGLPFFHDLQDFF